LLFRGLIFNEPEENPQMSIGTIAAHAMEDKGGTLEITLKDITIDRSTMSGNSHLKPGNYIEIMVADTELGIEHHIIEKIYEPYFTTKGPGEGTGMGLAMVHGIVETYSGKIFVESRLGTFLSIHLVICCCR
jgi:signal transduction histidine kinase